MKNSTSVMPPLPEPTQDMSLNSEMLTPSEIESLRRAAKEVSDSALKAFSQLPKVKPKS